MRKRKGDELLSEHNKKTDTKQDAPSSGGEDVPDGEVQAETTSVKVTVSTLRFSQDPKKQAEMDSAACSPRKCSY